MGHTRLMIGVHEAAVRGPAIACEHTGERLAEDRRRISKPPTRPNRVDRRVRRGERPQPVQRAPDLPAGFVGTHDRTAADLRTQHVVRRGRTRCRARTHMHERAAGHANAEAIPEQRDDVRERQPEPFMQDDDERRGFGADLHRRRPECIRRLERMSALDASTARRTGPDVDTEFADDGPDHRQILLILRHEVRPLHVAATRGTRVGEPGVMGLIDPAGNGPPAVATVSHTGAPAWWTTAALSMGFGKGGRLTEARPARSIELILQSLVAALQPITLPLGARQRVAQSRNLLLLSLDQRVAIVRHRRRGHIGHTLVMPEGRNLYKYEILDLRRSRAGTR